EELGNFELFLVRHGGAGALLTVAQGGVEYDHAVLLGLCLGSHAIDPSRQMRHLGALWVLRQIPRVPRHICPVGPQGRIRRRSVPRMREAADPDPAVRPIARIFLRVDMECSLISSVNLTGLGNARVNRPAFSGKGQSKSSAPVTATVYCPIC